MKKKLLSLAICLVLVAVAVCALVACDDGDYDYAITIWVGEGTDVITKQMIENYNNTNPDGIKFKATVEIVSESKAAGNAIATPQSAADLFCFAQDQLARLVETKLLATVMGPAQDAIIANNDEETVEASKIGGTIRAFPFTKDNGYFMYYDKRVVKESSIGSLEAIIKDIQGYNGDNLGRRFSMNVTGGWYAASFFYATGCVSNWTTNANGGFTSYTDTFSSNKGEIALKGIKKLFDSGILLDNKEVSAEDFNAGIPAAVVVSGIWDYNAAKTALRENLGVAPLPSFNVDGQDYQMVSYLGHKFLGVKNQTDRNRSYYLQDLATYLTSKECQELRFDTVGWGPSHVELQNLEKVKQSQALSALFATELVVQGQYPTAWWAEVETLVGKIKDYGLDDVANYLDLYKNNLGTMVTQASN